MIAMRRFVAVFLCASLVAYASSQGNSFDRVRYNGGTISNPVDPKDWGNHLTVTSDAIVFRFKNGQEITINPKSVTTLSYGQEAHRRVGTMIALAILVAPVALFGLFHKTRLHFIGMEWTADGKKDGMLLQGDKDNYRAILVALQSVSGVPVSVSEKEREFIPVGVTTNVTKGPTQEAGETAAPSDAGATTVNLSSTPEGVDVYVDGQFVGNSPASLRMKPGKHLVTAKMNGFSDWERELTVSGGTINLNAKLMPGSSATAPESPSSRTVKSQEPSTGVNVEPPTGTQRSAEPSDSSGWIGVTTKDDATRGVVITKVLPSSSAARAGLQAGDVIVELNGKPVKSGMEFDVAITRSAPGTQVRIAYMRGAWRFEVQVTVGKIGSTE